MRFLKTFFDFYLDSSVHVALSVLALSVITCIHLDISVDKNVAAALFFGAVTGYNFIKFSPLASRYLIAKNKNLKVKLFFSGLTGLVALWFCWQIHPLTYIWVVAIVLLAVFYAVPIRSDKYNLRSVRGVKLYVVALVWALATVMLPVVDELRVMDATVFFEFIQRFVFVLVLTIPFEIRDMDSDNERLNTLPQHIGVKGSKISGTALMVVFAGVEVWREFKFGEGYLIAGILVLMITLLFLWRSERNQSKYYSSFFVESIPVFWLFLLCVV